MHPLSAISPSLSPSSPPHSLFPPPSSNFHYTCLTPAPQAVWSTRAVTRNGGLRDHPRKLKIEERKREGEGVCQWTHRIEVCWRGIVRMQGGRKKGGKEREEGSGGDRKERGREWGKEGKRVRGREEGGQNSIWKFRKAFPREHFLPEDYDLFLIPLFVRRWFGEKLGSVVRNPTV